MAGAGLIGALGMRLHSQIIERISGFLVLLKSLLYLRGAIGSDGDD